MLYKGGQLVAGGTSGGGGSSFDPSKFHTIFFNPGNAQSIEFTTKSLYEGSKFGRLPTYTINGTQYTSWYKDQSNTEMINENSIFNDNSDIELFSYYPYEEQPTPGPTPVEPIEFTKDNLIYALKTFSGKCHLSKFGLERTYTTLPVTLSNIITSISVKSPSGYYIPLQIGIDCNITYSANTIGTLTFTGNPPFTTTKTITATISPVDGDTRYFGTVSMDVPVKITYKNY